MPLGDGFFYDRNKKKYIRIDEHATDAVTRPDVFNSHDVKHLNPTTDRDQIVIHVLKNGFIRVRHWKERLGWQFWGNPQESLDILKKYIRKNGLGLGCIITFTDFSTGKNVECAVEDIKKKDFLSSF